LKSSSFLHSFIISCSLENDPLSPPEGEAAQREHPRNPRFFGVYFNLLRSYRNRGDAQAAGEKDEKLEPPRAIVYFSMRVSTKPEIIKIRRIS
jgi:hypothetical protein